MKRIVVWTLAITILFSCEEKNDVGLSLQNPDDLIGSSLIDTLSIEARTVLNNSDISSDSVNVLLAGSFLDPFSGQLTAKSYTQFVPSENNINLGTTPIYDSARVEFTYTRSGALLNQAHSYGDTTAPIGFDIYRVTSVINKQKYTTLDNVSIDASPLQSNTSSSRNPFNDSLITFSLDNTIGTELFGYLSDSASFVNNFNGISLQGTPGQDAAVYGFNTSTSRILVFYHNTGGPDTAILSISNNAIRFNQISSDFSGQGLSGFSGDGSNATEAATNNNLISQSGIGLGIHFHIPSLPSVMNSIQNAAINRATLSLTIADGTYNGLNDEPVSFLIGYESDSTYTFIKDVNGNNIVIENDNHFVNSSSTSLFSFDGENQYILPLTSYFQDMAFSNREVTDLILFPVFNSTRVNRSIIVGPNNAAIDQRPELKIYYTK